MAPGKKRSLEHNEDAIHDLCHEVYSAVMKKRNAKLKELLRKHLKDARELLLLDDDDDETSRLFQRLPSNTDASSKLLSELFCQPCNQNNNYTQPAQPSEATPDDWEPMIITSAQTVVAPFCYKFRSDKNKLIHESIGPPLFLEGTAPNLPSSSATIFLKTHYATDDEQTLKYVPYFGEDDEEDVVSDLYNLTEREKQMEFGPEYRERDTNNTLDEILVLLQRRLDQEYIQTPALHSKIHLALGAIMDEYVDRIHQRYEVMIGFKKAPAPPAARGKSTSARKQLKTYADAMDSYRPLFCRRCFLYDCNMHSNLHKPSLELQGELAIQKDRDGLWNEQGVDETAEGDGKAAAEGSNEEDEEERKKPATISPSRSKQEQAGRKRPDAEELTQAQKAICERMFLVFQGDTQKMATTMGASQDAVEDYCSDRYQLKPYRILEDDQVQMFHRRKKKKGGRTLDQSMNHYNPTWLKRVENAEIHPFFVPCDHEGPCNETDCSCVRNAVFCSKHCAYGVRSRNFFRGCACSGKCTTKSCACFAAKRECDPDLCKTCGACTDPANSPAQGQRCRNDTIGMRRHTQVMLGKSQIADAGWGLFNRFPLKKGDYVHEYVGEVISQEEAERRGRIYDKVNRSYLFNLSSDYVVDASRKGNKTRFANHSSKPNCYTKMVNVNGDIRIGLFAREDIEPQSELFFDYRYDVSMDNDLIVKPGMTVDWMKNSKMANQISNKSIIKKHA